LSRGILAETILHEKPKEMRNGCTTATEDQFTETIESYTAAVPSAGYLAIAIGAMSLSLACQLAGRGKWGNFIAQWVPTWLIMGLYNKLVGLEGHDRYQRGRHVDWQRTAAKEANAGTSGLAAVLERTKAGGLVPD
jgi:hypothetical protein